MWSKWSDKLASEGAGSTGSGTSDETMVLGGSSSGDGVGGGIGEAWIEGDVWYISSALTRGLRMR